MVAQPNKMEYATPILLALQLVWSVLTFIVNTRQQTNCIEAQEERIQYLENIYGILITPSEYTESDQNDESHSALRIARMPSSVPTNTMEMGREKRE